MAMVAATLLSAMLPHGPMARAKAAEPGGFAATESDREIDVKETEPARRAAEALKHLARGNERSAGWDYLKLNLDTRVVKGKAWVRSKHRVRGITVYSWTVHAEFTLDLNSGGSDVVIDFGRGIKIRASELTKILSAL